MHLQIANLSVLWRFRSPVPFVPDPVRNALRRVYPKDAAARLTRVDGTEGGGVVLALQANNDPAKATACVYDPATGDVQVRGSRLEDVLKMHDKTLVALEKHVSELASKLLFSEALVEGWLASKHHPLTKLRSVMGPEVAGKWGKAILSTDAQPFGLRICTSNPFPPTEPINKIACWRELRIEPMVANPNNFWVSIIIRDSDYKVVRREFRHVKDKLAWIERQLGADIGAE